MVFQNNDHQSHLHLASMNQVDFSRSSQICTLLECLSTQASVTYKSTHSNAQMIWLIFCTGLLPLKMQKIKHNFLNMSCPTSQDKKSLTVLWLGWIHSLYMLDFSPSEWRVKIFVLHFTGFAQWHSSHFQQLWYYDTYHLILMIKNGPKHLAVVVVLVFLGFHTMQKISS